MMQDFSLILGLVALSEALVLVIQLIDLPGKTFNKRCRTMSGNVWHERLAIRDGSEPLFLAAKAGERFCPLAAVLQVGR